MNTTDSKTSLNYNQLTAEFDDFLTALRIALPNLKPGTILQNLSLEKVRRDQEIKNQQILVNQILKKMISWIAQKSSTTGLNMTKIAQKLALVLHPDKLSGNNSENGLY